MSRYISKLPEPIRELAEKRRSEQNPDSKEDDLASYNQFDWSKTPEGWSFWSQINFDNYSIFYTLYPQKDCTCNSRTVDESGNVVHFEECEKEKDKLDELIEWMEQAVELCKEQELSFRESEMENAASCSGAMGMAYQLTINKAKEIKGK